MKLVVATPLYPPEIGGPATYAAMLERGLPERGIEVEVVKFGEVRHLPKLIRHYAYYRRVLRAARSADAVLALDPVSVGLPAMQAAQRAKKPFVVKIVGDYAWEQGRQRFGISTDLDTFVATKRVPLPVRLLRSVETRVATRASRVIVPSEYLKRIVVAWGHAYRQAGVPVDRISVVYNGVELPSPVMPVSRPEGFLVVSSGRRVPWKGFEAIERVVAREEGWHARIASGLPRVEALGWVKSADVYVLNSTYEGFPHALLEAMLLGTPVVATSAGGNTELVEDGVTGLVIPPNDEDALHAALRQVAADPVAAHERAQRALARMTSFSPAAMLDRTSDVLLEIGHPMSKHSL